LDGSLYDEDGEENSGNTSRKDYLSSSWLKTVKVRKTSFQDDKLGMASQSIRVEDLHPKTLGSSEVQCYETNAK
jgi:hypothetical protein